MILMLSKIWTFFILGSLLYAFFNQTLNEVIEGIFVSGEDSVKVCIQILPGMCFFCGILKIAESSGIIKKIGSIATPLIARLFPDIPKNHPAIPLIVINTISNMFGAGNAATAFGLKAMKELQKINRDKSMASDAMGMFIILNTCTIVFFPTSIVSMRHVANSIEPGFVILPITFVSIIVCFLGVIMCKLSMKMFK
jgi:spore maturation protein A